MIFCFNVCIFQNVLYYFSFCKIISKSTSVWKHFQFESEITGVFPKILTISKRYSVSCWFSGLSFLRLFVQGIVCGMKQAPHFKQNFNQQCPSQDTFQTNLIEKLSSNKQENIQDYLRCNGTWAKFLNDIRYTFIVNSFAQVRNRLCKSLYLYCSWIPDDFNQIHFEILHSHFKKSHPEFFTKIVSIHGTTGDFEDYFGV